MRRVISDKILNQKYIDEKSGTPFTKFERLFMKYPDKDWYTHALRANPNFRNLYISSDKKILKKTYIKY